MKFPLKFLSLSLLILIISTQDPTTQTTENTTSENSTNETTYCTSKCCSDRFDKDNLNSDPNYYNYSNFSYCKTVVTWAISEEVYNTRETRDQQALAQYKAIYEKWKDPNRAETDDPTNDCLGIARIVFCSYQYPLCMEEQGDQYGVVCNFLCSLYQQRCPSETEAYNTICANKSSSGCAKAINLVAQYGKLFIQGFIILLLLI